MLVANLALLLYGDVSVIICHYSVVFVFSLFVRFCQVIRFSSLSVLIHVCKEISCAKALNDQYRFFRRIDERIYMVFSKIASIELSS